MSFIHVQPKFIYILLSNESEFQMFALYFQQKQPLYSHRIHYHPKSRSYTSVRSFLEDCRTIKVLLIIEDFKSRKELE